MRHKNWKTYLKIACSWLLIFSICFMNLETVSASEDERKEREVSTYAAY